MLPESAALCTEYDVYIESSTVRGSQPSNASVLIQASVQCHGFYPRQITAVTPPQCHSRCARPAGTIRLVTGVSSVRELPPSQAPKKLDLNPQVNQLFPQAEEI